MDEGFWETIDHLCSVYMIVYLQLLSMRRRSLRDSRPTRSSEQLVNCSLPVNRLWLLVSQLELQKQKLH